MMRFLYNIKEKQGIKAMAFVLIFVFIFISLSIYAKEPKVAKYACIMGKIERYRYGDVYVGFYKNYLNYTKLVAAEDTTSKYGEFKMKFRWDYPWPVYLVFGELTVNLFLSPGDSIYIEASHSNFYKTFKLSGTGATENTYLNNFLLTYDIDNLNFRKTFIELPEKTFLKQNDARHEIQLKYLEKNDSLQENIFFYNYAMALIDFEYYNNFFVFSKTKGKYIDSDYLADVIDTVKIDNQFALPSMLYIDFLNNYVDFMIYKYKNESEDKIMNIWDFKYRLIRNRFSGRVRDLLLAKVLKSAFEYTYNISAMNLYNDYKNICISNDYMSYLRNTFVLK
jgi:hypothetical protein